MLSQVMFKHIPEHLLVIILLREIPGHSVNVELTIMSVNIVISHYGRLLNHLIPFPDVCNVIKCEWNPQKSLPVCPSISIISAFFLKAARATLSVLIFLLCTAPLLASVSLPQYNQFGGHSSCQRTLGLCTSHLITTCAPCQVVNSLVGTQCMYPWAEQHVDH